MAGIEGGERSAGLDDDCGVVVVVVFEAGEDGFPRYAALRVAARHHDLPA